MRFSHTADCHLGGLRDPRLRALSEEAFSRFVSESIAAKVDFTIIAGDLFNTPIPGIDALKCAVTHLTRLREAGIPVYAIGGSHDASPSGKSILDVLERAQLLTDVGKGEEQDGTWKPTIAVDPTTGALLTGISGRQGMLDHHRYRMFDRASIDDPERTIFLVHTAISEINNIPGALPASALPPGCAYYASGHVHTPTVTDVPGVGIIGFPGPLFPNSFSELEELEHGGYLLVENGRATRKPVALARVTRIRIDANGKTPQAVLDEVRERVTTSAIEGTIVTLRIEGTLGSGSSADLDLRTIAREASERGAIALLRNTAKLTSKDLDADENATAQPEQDVEEVMLRAHSEQLALPGTDIDGEKLARTLLAVLAREQLDGEKLIDYRDSVVTEALRALADASEKKD